MTFPWDSLCSFLAFGSFKSFKSFSGCAPSAKFSIAQGMRDSPGIGDNRLLVNFFRAGISVVADHFILKIVRTRCAHFYETQLCDFCYYVMRFYSTPLGDTISWGQVDILSPLPEIGRVVNSPWLRKLAWKTLENFFYAVGGAIGLGPRSNLRFRNSGRAK